MFDYDYRSIVERPDDDHVRLLTLAPSRDWTDAIHVRLAEVKLSSDLTYEALSYCWGDITKRTLISCDGKPFLVSENLESALRHLRLEETERVLWIDAVCINQKDDNERTHQVNLMRSIYGRAKTVLVWLGDAGDDSDLAFDVCERITAARSQLLTDGGEDLQGNNFLWGPNKNKIIHERLKELKSRKGVAQTQSEDAKQEEAIAVSEVGDGDDGEWVDEDSNSLENASATNNEAAEDVPDATREEVVAILRLISRPWFARCWVIQEFVLGKEVQFICGSSSIEWSVFYVGFTLIVLFGGQGLEGRPEQLSRAGLVLLTIFRMQIQSPEASPVPFDIIWLLQKARPFGATDPRDKIYSLLGLIPPGMTTLSSLTPDYTISVEECYKRAALAVISHKHNLDVLITDRQTTCAFQLPSWVPDWSMLERPAPIALFQETEDKVDEATKIPTFCASLEKSWIPDVNHDTNVLILSGYVLDRIVLVEDLLTVPEMDFVDLNSGLSSVHDYASLGKRLFSGLGTYFDMLIRWEKMAFSKSYPVHPTKDDLELVYAMTLCAGDIPDGPEQGLQKFRRWRETLRAPKKLSFLKSLGMKGSFYNTLSGLSGMVSGRKSLGDRVFATATEKTLYRRLARTEKGYLALVPRLSAVGDQIALFKGGKTPFLVRQTKETAQWELVGASYIHGLMYGEQWKVELCHGMAIK